MADHGTDHNFRVHIVNKAAGRANITLMSVAIGDLFGEVLYLHTAIYSANMRTIQFSRLDRQIAVPTKCRRVFMVKRREITYNLVTTSHTGDLFLFQQRRPLNAVFVEGYLFAT